MCEYWVSSIGVSQCRLHLLKVCKEDQTLVSLMITYVTPQAWIKWKKLVLWYVQFSYHQSHDYRDRITGSSQSRCWVTLFSGNRYSHKCTALHLLNSVFSQTFKYGSTSFIRNKLYKILVKKSYWKRFIGDTVWLNNGKSWFLSVPCWHCICTNNIFLA